MLELLLPNYPYDLLVAYLHLCLALCQFVKRTLIINFPHWIVVVSVLAVSGHWDDITMKEPVSATRMTRKEALVSRTSEQNLAVALKNSLLLQKILLGKT